MREEQRRLRGERYALGQIAGTQLAVAGIAEVSEERRPREWWIACETHCRIRPAEPMALSSRV